MKTPNFKHLIRLLVGSVLSFIAVFSLVGAFLSKSLHPDFAPLLTGLILAGVAVYLFSGAPPLARVTTRFLFAVGLGFLTPIVFILGASPFEVQGQNSIQENLAGCVAVALYVAVCQFWLSRMGGGGFRAAWPVMVGMMASLLAVWILLVNNWPEFVSGGIGCLAGMLLSMSPRAKVNNLTV